MSRLRVCVFVLACVVVVPPPASAGIMTLLDILNEMSGPGKWYGFTFEYSFSCAGKAVTPVRDGLGRLRRSQASGRLQTSGLGEYTVPLKSQSCEPDDADPILKGVLDTLSSHHVAIVRVQRIREREIRFTAGESAFPIRGEVVDTTCRLARAAAPGATRYECDRPVTGAVQVRLTGGDVPQLETITTEMLMADGGDPAVFPGIEVTLARVTVAGVVDLNRPVRSLGLVYQYFLTTRFGDVAYAGAAPKVLSAHLVLPYIHQDWNSWITSGFGGGAMIIARGFGDAQSIHPALQVRGGIRPLALVAHLKRRPSNAAGSTVESQRAESDDIRRKGALVVTAGYTLVPWMEAADFGGVASSWRFAGDHRRIESILTLTGSVDLSRLLVRPSQRGAY